MGKRASVFLIISIFLYSMSATSAVMAKELCPNTGAECPGDYHCSDCGGGYYACCPPLSHCKIDGYGNEYCGE